MNSVRYIVSLVTLAALAASLVGGPMFHVHAAPEHGHGGSEGVVVHSHFPEVRASGPDSHESEGNKTPAFDGPTHDGRSLDFFLSLEGKAIDGLVETRSDWGVVVLPETFRKRCSVRCDRTHDPPVGGLSSRAPPV